MGELMHQFLDEVCFQVALWTFAQGRESFREAWDVGQKGRNK